jgi:hypothetical protein
MVVLAGPVFPEWYWSPIFFLIAYSPLLAVGTGVAYAVARRRGWRPAGSRRLLLWAACFAVALVAVLGLHLGWRAVIRA